MIIDRERCKGCGLCVEFCPQGVLEISGQSNQKGYFPAEVTGGDCTGCAICGLMCPDVAVEVRRDESSKLKVEG